MSAKRNIVQATLREHHSAPTRTIVSIIYKSDHGKLWKTKEAIRSSVRYYRNEKGYTPTKIISERTKTQRTNAMGWNKLPESQATEYTPFVLPLASKRILLLSDIHFPFHDLRALETALQHGKDRKADTIFLNGDILDMYSMSRYVKEPGRVDIGSEIEMLTNFLRLLKEEFQCPIYFKWGNHEERWESYLRVKAAELLSISEFRLDVLCKFGEIGVVEIKDKRIAMAGDLAILHGHEFGRSVFNPVNPARGFYLRSKRSMIAGHHHQSSEHSEKDLSGKVTTCWSTGCLSELNPEYMPLNKWNHGFAFVTLEGKNFEVDNMRIIDGRIR